jgi:ankyrin repeat protein
MGHVDLVLLLVARGADPDARGDRRQTPLHLAARCGHADCIEALAGLGVDVNARDVEGLTPLDYAIQGGRAEAAAALRAHGGRRGTGSAG